MQPEASAIYANDNEIIYFYNPHLEQIETYSNNTSTALSLPVDYKLGEQIAAIYTTTESQNKIVIIKDEKGLTYIDYEIDFVENFTQTGEILDITKDGNSIIYKDHGEVYAYVLEPTYNNESYNTETKKINVALENLQTIYFSPLGTNMIALITEKDTRTLWLMDYDGQNMRKLLTEKSISGTTSQITNNGSTLYLLLEDSPSVDAEIPSTKNIYKVDLEVK
jgi:hypothetical protein